MNKLMKHWIYILFSIGLVIYWISQKEYIDVNISYVDSTLGFFSLIIAAVGAWLIVEQLKETKRVQEADFIIHLNQAFASNKNYAKMYCKLEKNAKNNKELKLSNIDISNYLTFFETMYILLRKGVVDIATLDDLFAYRFFLAIHNKTVQNKKLVKEPHNFRNIYYLEKIWIDYRIKHGLEIYKIENCLYDSCKDVGKEAIYDEIMKKQRSYKCEETI